MCGGGVHKYQEHRMKHNVITSYLAELRYVTTVYNVEVYAVGTWEAKVISIHVKYACCIDTAYRYNKSCSLLFRNEKIAICRVFFMHISSERKTDGQFNSRKSAAPRRISMKPTYKSFKYFISAYIYIYIHIMHVCGKGAWKCSRLRIKIVECVPTYFTNLFKYADFLAKLGLIFRFYTCGTIHVRASDR